MGRVNVPLPFAGTDEEKTNNRSTHQWASIDGTEIVCYRCDAKIWHAGANYPCGTRPPREVVELSR